jgi:hypothetical protein
MSHFLDLILPPIIVGMLLLMIVSLTGRMTESQIDARLNGEMQQFANVALSALQEELRHVDEIEAISESELHYQTIDGDLVSITHQGRDLLVSRKRPNVIIPEVVRFPARLTAVRFQMIQLQANGPNLLRVYVESESVANEKMTNSPARQRSYAQRDFFLRNIN